MRLYIKIGLGFLFALLGSVVVFGNFIAPTNTLRLQKTAAIAPSLAKLNLNGQPNEESTRYINPATSASLEDNLTKNLAGVISKEIIDLNPEGPLDKKLTVAQAQIIAEKALIESFKDIDTSSFSPIISSHEIIIADNSHYTASLAVILQEHTDALKKQPLTTTPTEDISTVLPIYEHTAAELKKLPVPRPSIATHQSIISLIVGQLSALRALEDYERDPVRGLVALRAFTAAQEKLTALTPKLSS